jgi:hypothetical protein
MSTVGIAQPRFFQVYFIDYQMREYLSIWEGIASFPPKCLSSTKDESKMDQNVDKLIQGYADWIGIERCNGWLPYYINIMFYPLNASSFDHIMRAMQHAIYHHFYPTLCKRFARHPHRKSQEHLLPLGALFFDFPTWKRQKHSLPRGWVNQNTGLHLNGFILVPPKSHLRDEFATHVTMRQDLYVDRVVNGKSVYDRGGIERVHVEPMDRCHHRVADYSMKTIKAGKVNYDTTIILPRLASELKSGIRTLDAKSRAIRDIQAATNVSDQVAEIIYRTSC